MFARISTRAVRSVISQPVRGNATRNVNAAVKAKQQKYYADISNPTPIMFRESGDKFRVAFCASMMAFGFVLVLRGWWNMAWGTGKVGRE